MLIVHTRPARPLAHDDTSRLRAAGATERQFTPSPFHRRPDTAGRPALLWEGHTLDS